MTLLVATRCNEWRSTYSRR